MEHEDGGVEAGTAVKNTLTHFKGSLFFQLVQLLRIHGVHVPITTDRPTCMYVYVYIYMYLCVGTQTNLVSLDR